MLEFIKGGRDMERLTKRNSDGSVGISDFRYYNYDDFQKLASRLADYEDAEEQGLLPKFHLGDEFWTKWLGKPLKAKIVMLQQKKNGIWKYRFCDEQSHTHDYEENEFGKYFWTTKEEAEQALKQMGE